MADLAGSQPIAAFVPPAIDSSQTPGGLEAVNPARAARAPHATPHAAAPDELTPLVQTFIVEDSPIILDNLIATLEEMAPVQVVGHATDELTAIQHLRQRSAHLDLVIIDIFLQSGSGLGVLRGASDLGIAARRVVLTNYATPSMREKCRVLGADRVFDKSKDLDALIEYCTGMARAGPGATNA